MRLVARLFHRSLVDTAASTEKTFGDGPLLSRTGIPLFLRDCGRCGVRRTRRKTSERDGPRGKVEPAGVQRATL